MTSSSPHRALLLLCCTAWLLLEPDLVSAAAPGTLDSLESRWARIYYGEPGAPDQERRMAGLAQEAALASSSAPRDAEILIWQAIILSSKAQIEGGISGLHDAELARDSLLRAEVLNDKALSGLVYTSLGVLYERVPDWPIGFGDKKLAEEYLLRGLSLNPDGLDANFFYGEFLFNAHDFVAAEKAVRKALEAPLSGNELVFTGRHQEAEDLLKKIVERSK